MKVNLVSKVLEDRTHIRFNLIKELEKTNIYGVFTKTDDLIGIVKWYPRWKQYCFFPDKETIWNNGSLKDLQNFIKQVNKK
jgi:hypothetical protein